VESTVAANLDAAFEKKLEDYKQTVFDLTERVPTGSSAGPGLGRPDQPFDVK
jgi:hypothetical protein